MRKIELDTTTGHAHMTQYVCGCEEYSWSQSPVGARVVCPLWAKINGALAPHGIFV